MNLHSQCHCTVCHYLDSAPPLLCLLSWGFSTTLALLLLTVTMSSGWYGTWIRTTSLLLITVDDDCRLTS